MIKNIKLTNDKCTLCPCLADVLLPAHCANQRWRTSLAPAILMPLTAELRSTPHHEPVIEITRWRLPGADCSFVLLHLGADRHPRAIAVNEPPMECEDTPEIANDCVNDDDANTDAVLELLPPGSPG